MKKYFFILILLLSGCMVGPNYNRPDINMPPEYCEYDKENIPAVSLKNWWETFEDPILSGLIDKAIYNNYNLKIAFEKIEETRAYYRIRKADLFPEIDVNATAARVKNSKNLITTSFIPKNSYNLFKIGFDALWEIDIFGKLRREKEAAFYDIEFSKENVRNVYISLISDVARYYFDICTVQNIISLVEEKINLQKKIFSLSDNLYTTGLENKIIEEFEFVSLKQEEENLLFYKTFLKQTSYSLATLLSENPENILQDINKYNKIPIVTNKINPGLPSILLRQRPDIKMAEKKLSQATAKIGAAIAEYFPNFSLTGNAQFDSNNTSKLFNSNSQAWGIGSIFNWPIITFGRIRANVDVKKSQQKQALLSYENTVIEALKDVESALVAYYNEEKKLIEIEEESQSLYKIASLEENKYVNGLNNLSKYYRARKNAIESAIKVLESKRALAHNVVSIYKALGGNNSMSFDLKEMKE